MKRNAIWKAGRLIAAVGFIWLIAVIVTGGDTSPLNGRAAIGVLVLGSALLVIGIVIGFAGTDSGDLGARNEANDLNDRSEDKDARIGPSDR